MRFIFPMLLAVCTTIAAAVPTSNLCEDEALGTYNISERSVWRVDSVYFAETFPGQDLNDWSWKYRYSATTEYPISITVDFFEGEGPKTYPFTPMDGGFYVQSSEKGFEYSTFQSKADTFVIFSWTTRNDTIVDSTRVSIGEHGQFGLRYDKGFVDTIKSFWSGDTFFDMRLYSHARNTATTTYHPSIDTCFKLSQDQCTCHKGSESELIVRTAWNDGFKTSKSQLDSTNGNFRTTRIYRPLSALTTVKRRAKGSPVIRPAETFRWNGARSPDASSSTNPLEHLRHGQIPATTTQP
ncbi:MAG: hypothetical protein AAB214_11000, partial [Fibrobacterota bacterium]